MSIRQTGDYAHTLIVPHRCTHAHTKRNETMEDIYVGPTASE